MQAQPKLYKLIWKSISKHIPTVLCHLFTAKSRLQVTVTTAGIVRCGSVLAATCVTGEFDGNLSTIITSCCIWSLNISGLCGRKHCWVERKREQKKRERITQLVRRSEGKIRLRESGSTYTSKGKMLFIQLPLQTQDSKIREVVTGEL